MDAYGPYLAVAERLLPHRGASMEGPPMGPAAFSAEIKSKHYVVLRARQTTGARAGEPLAYFFVEPGYENSSTSIADAIGALPKTGEVVFATQAESFNVYPRGTFDSARRRGGRRLIRARFSQLRANFPAIEAVPPQRVLPAEEAAAALGGRDPRTLRCMFEHETAALWNGAAPNDIVEISLPSDGAGVRLDYRRCVAAPPKSD